MITLREVKWIISTLPVYKQLLLMLCPKFDEILSRPLPLLIEVTAERHDFDTSWPCDLQPWPFDPKSTSVAGTTNITTIGI